MTEEEKAQLKKLEEEFKDHRHLGTDTHKVRYQDLEGAAAGSYARAYLNGAQSFDNSQAVTIALDTESLTTDGITFVAADKGFVIVTPGVYFIHGQFLMLLSDGESVRCIILQKNSGAIARGYMTGEGTGTQGVTAHASTLVSLAAGDTIVMQGAHDNAGALAVTNGPTFTYLELYKIA